MKTKYFVILFSVIACLHSVNAQYDFDAVERERMAKAKVKTQTQWTYDYVNGKLSVKGYKSCVTKYNVKGNITEVINFNESGEIISLTIYQYDSRDNRVNWERYQGNRNSLLYSQKIQYDVRGNKVREYGYDGATIYNNTYVYGADGKLSEITYTLENLVVEKRTLKATGNKTEIMVYDPANKLVFRQENTYNNSGFLISEIKTGGTGNVLHSLDMQYNNIGGLMEETRKRADDKLDYRKLYHYNNDNRPVKEETVNLDGTKYISHEYQYNNTGDLISESWKKNNRTKESSTKKLIYDSKGLYTEVECYFASYKLHSLYKYTYEFY